MTPRFHTRRSLQPTSRELAGDKRYQKWRECPIHLGWSLLMTDTGEYYCPRCYTLWDPESGEMLNLPLRRIKPKYEALEVCASYLVVGTGSQRLRNYRVSWARGFWPTCKDAR